MVDKGTPLSTITIQNRSSPRRCTIPLTFQSIPVQYSPPTHLSNLQDMLTILQLQPHTNYRTAETILKPYLDTIQYAFSGHSAAEGRQISAAARNPKMPPENPKMPPENPKMPPPAAFFRQKLPKCRRRLFFRRKLPNCRQHLDF